MTTKERSSTFLDHTRPDLEMGGRFAAEAHHTVVGRDDPIPQYGHTAPWSETQLPDEMPLGYAIDDQEPVGTEAEIRESLNSNAPSVAVGDESTVPLSVAKSEEMHRPPAPASPRTKSSVASAADRGGAVQSAAPNSGAISDPLRRRDRATNNFRKRI
jgi:hypothetical protein